MQHWIAKFQNAFRGLYFGVRGQSSFAVHLPVAFAVLGLAMWMDCSWWQLCVIGLCIGLVLALELVNSAIETLAKALCQEHNELVGRALDMASAAVLLASLVAAAIGLTIVSIQFFHSPTTAGYVQESE
ncbi:MAG: diacylglycerol kinase [Planctomycetales bacterium]|nr:diacylglycerol kinase [Planctomycetales bacterium]